MSSLCLASSERTKVKYLKTSDGDTMRAVIDGENVRIRFLGINTPEVSGENKVEEPWGNEALAYTQKRLDEAQKIEIEFDDVADHEDRFGRKLAWIWVDDELFEVELLEQGMAKTYMLQNDYKYAKELKEAEQKAKKEKLGVWSGKTPEEYMASKQASTIENTSDSAKKISQDTLKEPELEWTYEGDEEGFSWGTILAALLIIIIIVIVSQKKSKYGQKQAKNRKK